MIVMAMIIIILTIVLNQMKIYVSCLGILSSLTYIDYMESLRDKISLKAIN